MRWSGLAWKILKVVFLPPWCGKNIILVRIVLEIRSQNSTSSKISIINTAAITFYTCVIIFLVMRAPLQTIKAGYPMQIVSVDLMGPLPETEDGCKYVMVAVDCFTRWVEVYAIRNQEATTVAKKTC